MRILISAGEASGDRLGAGLARALLRQRPDLELIGMGGEEMAAAGVRRLQDMSEVSVVGFVEVLSRLGALRKAMRRLETALTREAPDLLVPIDFPDFNLRLADRARGAGVPVVYFVSPQIWAWRSWRVRKIRRLVRRMLVLFPFEKEIYEREGVPVTFVGHPAADVAIPRVPRVELLARARLDPSRATVALLPGSRVVEVSRILPRMLAAASLLREGEPDLQFVIPRARGLPNGLVESMVARAGVPDVRVHDGDYPEILTACAAGAVTSGTATLDAAMAGLPMVVVYRLHPLSYLLARLLVRVDHVAPVNLVAGARLVPELIQRDCSPQGIARAVGSYLASPELSERTRLGLVEVVARLGGPGAFDRAAREVLAEGR